ncbi:hypothetical protein [Sporosarcina sp. E16_8]|nr:hypothetical protein [Sporosarcina sp. E16_8]
MKYFLVGFSHTDMIGWKKHVNAHIYYLEQLIGEKKSIAHIPR